MTILKKVRGKSLKGNSQKTDSPVSSGRSDVSISDPEPEKVRQRKAKVKGHLIKSDGVFRKAPSTAKKFTISLFVPQICGATSHLTAVSTNLKNNRI